LNCIQKIIVFKNNYSVRDVKKEEMPIALPIRTDFVETLNELNEVGETESFDEISPETNQGGEQKHDNDG